MNLSVPFHTLIEPELMPGESVEDLQLNGLGIIQRRDGFRFGTDAVQLAHFTKVRKRDRVADFGTGSGIIAILLCAYNPEITVDAIEIQEDIASMAQRSVNMNGLDGRIAVHNMDIKQAPALLGRGVYDVITCNPPYYDASTAIKPQSLNKLISRTDTLITIDEICAAAAAMLKSGGRLSVVYPAMRMYEMMKAMDKAALAPKRVRTVHATSRHPARLALIDGVKHGGSQLDWLPPLILNE